MKAYLKVLASRFIPSLHHTQLFRLMPLHVRTHTHTHRRTRTYAVRAIRVIDLGGAQFVENLAEHCASQFQQLHGIDLRPIARSMVRAASRLLSRLHARASPHSLVPTQTRIRRVCRRAMEALSQQVQVPIEVDWVHRESELDLQCTYVGSSCPAAQFEWVVVG